MGSKLRNVVKDSVAAMLSMPPSPGQDPWFETVRTAAWLRLGRPRKPSRTLADNTLRAAMKDKGLAGIVAPEFAAYRQGSQVKVVSRPAYAFMAARSDPLNGRFLGGPGGRAS